MENYFLFKQLVTAILFFEQLVLWSRFQLYFGFKSHPFNLLLLASLAMVFFDWYPIVGSGVALCCMRYLFVNWSQFGAVGHLCYLTVAYIFFLEVGRAIGLFPFIYTIFAIEIGIILLTAGLHKAYFGYLKGEGYEYALVNPNWGKLYFLFNKLNPRSLFFKVCNWAAVVGELAAGVLLFIPEWRHWGAIIMIALFAFVFLTARVNVLPLLMIAIGILFLEPTTAVSSDAPWLWIIRLAFILYLVLYIMGTVLRFIKPEWKFWLMRARPYFDWDVFTPAVTDYFVKIEKDGEVIYDGNPRPFSRFMHHHDSSMILGIFSPLRFFSKEPDREKLLRYAKTFGDKGEVVFTVIRIGKGPHRFIYVPVGSIKVLVG